MDITRTPFQEAFPTATSTSEFRIIDAAGDCNHVIGDIYLLIEDDGTDCPRFRNSVTSKERYSFLHRFELVNEIQRFDVVEYMNEFENCWAEKPALFLADTKGILSEDARFSERYILINPASGRITRTSRIRPRVPEPELVKLELEVTQKQADAILRQLGTSNGN